MFSTTVDVQEFAGAVKHAAVASGATFLTVAAADGLLTVTASDSFFGAEASIPAEGDAFCAQVNLRKTVQAAKSWKAKGLASLVFGDELLTLTQGDWCSTIPARRAEEDTPPLLPAPAAAVHVPAKPFAAAVAAAAVASDGKPTIPALGGVRFNGGHVSCTDRYRASLVHAAAPGLVGDVTVGAARKLAAALRPMCKAGTVAVAIRDGLYVESGGWRLLAHPAAGVLPDVGKLWNSEEVWRFDVAAADFAAALGVHAAANHVTLTPGENVIRLASDAGACTVPAALAWGGLGVSCTVSVKFARDMARAAGTGNLQLGCPAGAGVLQAKYEPGGLHIIAAVKIGEK